MLKYSYLKYYLHLKAAIWQETFLKPISWCGQVQSMHYKLTTKRKTAWAPHNTRSPVSLRSSCSSARSPPRKTGSISKNITHLHSRYVQEMKNTIWFPSVNMTAQWFTFLLNIPVEMFKLCTHQITYPRSSDVCSICGWFGLPWGGHTQRQQAKPWGEKISICREQS